MTQSLGGKHNGVLLGAAARGSELSIFALNKIILNHKPISKFIII